MTAPRTDPRARKHFDTIADFLAGIGILAVSTPGADGFLPGIFIRGETIFYDRRKAAPGDLLHEAGHIAVTPAMFRPLICKDTDQLLPEYMAWSESHPDAMGYPEDPIGRAILQSGETEAIAWSYAAAIEIGLEPRVVFRRGTYGFIGGESEIIRMCAIGAHAGIKGMHHAGMCNHREYPRMRRWMQI